MVSSSSNLNTVFSTLPLLNIKIKTSLGQVWVTTVTMAERSEYVGGVFAMKKAPVTNHIRHPMLLHEACALILLQGACRLILCEISWH